MKTAGKGFTLIELIVVIAIIAILAAIITPNAFKAIEKAKISAFVNTLKTMEKGMLSYYADTGVWMYRQGQTENCPGFSSNPSGCPYPYSVNTNTGDMGFMCNYCTALTGWDGPYTEKKITYNPWGGYYHINTSGAGARFYVTDIPESSRLKIDEMLDDNNPGTGRVNCYTWPGGQGLLYDWTL